MVLIGQVTIWDWARNVKSILMEWDEKSFNFPLANTRSHILVQCTQCKCSRKMWLYCSQSARLVYERLMEMNQQNSPSKMSLAIFLKTVCLHHRKEITLNMKWAFASNQNPVIERKKEERREPDSCVSNYACALKKTPKCLSIHALYE